MWRNWQAPSLYGEGSIDAGLIFPSGRQALTGALKSFGLRRKDRVAVPEWSSTCLIAAVGRQALPLPMTEVISYQIPIAALVLYEQWGWPFLEGTLKRVSDQFFGVPLVLDRVDSTQLSNPMLGQIVIRLAEIWSFSKTLGLRGGGLLRLDGEWVGFKAEQQSADILAVLDAINANSEFNEFAKTEISWVPKPVLEYVHSYDVESAYLQEAKARRENLAAVASLPGIAIWSANMKEVLKTECGPGIAPLFRGRGKDLLKQIAEDLAVRKGIETALYHFNFSIDPLDPKYELCLAVPVHGMVKPDFLTSALERWV